MSTLQIVVVLLVLVVLVAAGAVGWSIMRRRSLQRTFGPEYDREVENQESRTAAERELRERERRHASLELRELDPADRQRFQQQWQAVQAQFVEDPAGAVVAGDDLVTRLVAARGYPTKDFEDQLGYLSVEHARTLNHYRDAHEIYERGQRREASTEQLRQALVHYRALFADLLDAGTDQTPSAPDAESRQSAPDAESRLPAPDAESRLPAPDAESRQSAPDAESRQSAPDAESRQSAPDAESRQSAPDAEENAHA